MDEIYTLFENENVYRVWNNIRMSVDELYTSLKNFMRLDYDISDVENFLQNTVHLFNRTFEGLLDDEIDISFLEYKEYDYNSLDYLMNELRTIFSHTLPSYFDYAEKVNKNKGMKISVKDINAFLQFFEDVINVMFSKDIKQKITISKLKKKK